MDTIVRIRITDTIYLLLQHDSPVAVEIAKLLPSDVTFEDLKYCEAAGSFCQTALSLGYEVEVSDIEVRAIRNLEQNSIDKPLPLSELEEDAKKLLVGVLFTEKGAGEE